MFTRDGFQILDWYAGVEVLPGVLEDRVFMRRNGWLHTIARHYLQKGGTR